MVVTILEMVVVAVQAKVGEIMVVRVGLGL